MQFSDTTNGSGLIQECESFTGLGKSAISGNNDKLNEFTRNINNWYRKADTWIWQAAGDWDFDDSNYTTLPIGTCDLVSGQADYAVPTTARKIERVEILDVNGNYQLVSPTDKSQEINEALEDEDGFPEEYDMVGGAIYFHPTPKTGYVTLTDGLKLYCSRDISEFNATDTTAVAGFDNHFHRILSLGASYDWCVSKGLAKAQTLRVEIGQLENEIKEFYGSRHRDFKTRFGIIDESSI